MARVELVIYGAEYGDSCTCGTEIKMEELLKCGDFDGLASFCEQEELQVRNICLVSSPTKLLAWKLEPDLY